MEPFRKSIKDSEVNSKYDGNMHNMMHNSRVLTIPLIRCDQVFNRFIKHELIENTDNNGENQSSHFAVKCKFEEEINTTASKMKMDKYLNDNYVFARSVKIEFYHSE